jgi:hypothetical protein
VSQSSAQQRWILQPLVDAGLPRDRVHELLLAVAFAGVVDRGRLTPSHLRALVDDQPAVVRGAWVQVLDRMIGAGGG